MRIAILGNSGSGKSTLARWLVAQSGAAPLDLDTIAWDPLNVTTLRPPAEAAADVAAFCSSHARWVVEGCYANLVSAALPFAPLLLFLNPGREQCLAHCRARPWEPHKYASKAEQDERLPFLLSWVEAYYGRAGELSLAAHAACFEGYAGPKQLLLNTPCLALPSAEVQAWVG
jgi:adenylate kinase family enzyme